MKSRTRQLLEQADAVQDKPKARRASRYGQHIEQMLHDEEPDVWMAILVGLVARFLWRIDDDARASVARMIAHGALDVVEAMEAKQPPSVRH